MLLTGPRVLRAYPKKIWINPSESPYPDSDFVAVGIDESNPPPLKDGSPMYVAAAISRNRIYAEKKNGLDFTRIRDVDFAFTLLDRDAEAFLHDLFYDENVVTEERKKILEERSAQKEPPADYETARRAYVSARAYEKARAFTFGFLAAKVTEILGINGNGNYYVDLYNDPKMTRILVLDAFRRFGIDPDRHVIELHQGADKLFGIVSYADNVAYRAFDGVLTSSDANFIPFDTDAVYKAYSAGRQ